jgi:hypothetical protein
MRPALLITTLAALVIVAPCAAQTPAQPTPQKPIAHKPDARRSEAPETFVAVLSGAYEVPAVDTHATGTAELTLVGSRLRYRLHVDGIRDITGAYIHIGRAGEPAPAVADLFDGVKAGPVSGVLSSGTLELAALHGTTLHQLVRALQQDDAYVTVHTLAHPDGELRGQLRVQPAMASR